MAKSKDELEGEEERRESVSSSDGLEIISIGSLYHGAWDKKYWSSSRGKDRYPYPVGYCSIRAQNGSIYKMEIHEGFTGPLFMITCDGQSCSAQTPDIAWEKLQRTGCPRLKIWHGKRFSCKIDGVEFFGFKNPHVQRLLRELVANVKGAADADQCSTSSSFCIKTSATDSCNHHPNMCMNPDLLSYLPRIPKRKKRSPKCEIIKGELISNVGIKRTINQIDTYDSMVPITRKVKQVNCQQGTTVTPPTLKETVDDQSSPKVLPALLHVDHISPDMNEHSTNNACVKSSGSDDTMGEEGTIEQNNMSIKICRSSMELPRLQDTDLDQTTETEDKAKDSNVPKDSFRINSDNLIAPDTLDPILGYDYLPEQEIEAFDATTCSDKSDSDSIGHEMANSMMTVLLPQAVPLLKVSSKKKKGNLSSPNQVFPSVLKSQDDSTDTRCYMNVPSFAALPIGKSYLEELKAQMQDMDLGTIAFDSFEEQKHDDFATENTGPTNMVEAADVNLLKDQSNLNIHVKVPDVHGKEESSVCCVEVSGSEVTNTSTSKLKGVCSAEQSVQDHDGETGFAKVESSVQFQTKIYHRRKVSKKISPKNNCNDPLSESVACCDSGKATAIENFSKRENAVSLESCQASDEVSKIDSSCMDNGKQSQYVNHYQAAVHCARAPTTSVPVTIENKEKDSEAEALGRKDLADCSHYALSQNEGKDESDDKTSNTKPILSDSFNKLCRNLELYSDLEEVFQIVGCYIHPLPVSSLLVKEEGDEIYICVSCGLLTDNSGSLLVYKIALTEQWSGHPSFLGYTSITLPFSKDKDAQEVALQRCGLQFIPDGQNLALLGSIRTPYCSEGKLDCICSECRSDCSEDNTVKIVQIKPGYASVLTKLKTDELLQCIVVCENKLVAGGRSGRLHVFTMNSEWSAEISEEFIIPTGHCIPIVDMKRVSKFASLVTGHNGFGEFIVWDISRRLVVSRFSAPCCSVDQFLAFSWPSNFCYSEAKGHIDETMAAMKESSLEQAEHISCLLGDGEDLGIWLLLSTASNDDAQHEDKSGQNLTYPIRTWKLALLMNDSLILGSSLDARTTAAGALNGYGIGGTIDGLVYAWELSSGAKFGVLHHLKGRKVSCIATDESRSGILAVAADDGQMLLYLPNKPVFAHQQSPKDR